MSAARPLVNYERTTATKDRGVWTQPPADLDPQQFGDTVRTSGEESSNRLKSTFAKFRQGLDRLG